MSNINPYYNSSTLSALGELDEDFYGDFLDRLRERQLDNTKSIVYVHINSEGGALNYLWSVLSAMENTPKPICTFAFMKAHSCAAMLLAKGTKGYRYATRGTTILIHFATYYDPKFETHKIDLKGTKQILSELDYLTDNEEGYWYKKLSKIKNHTLVLSAEDAVKAKIIDHIGIPKFLGE